MLHPQKLLKKLSYLNVIFVFTCLILTGAVLWPDVRHTSQKGSSYRFNNETRSLEVVELEREGDSIHLILKNVSSKSITGVQVQLGRVTIQSEFLGGDETFLAGALHERYYPLQEGMDREGINILAAVFDDGSSEGNPEAVRQIKDKRLGEKTQLRRVLPLVQQAIEAPDADAPAALDRLRTDILGLQVERGNGLSDDFSLGLHDRKLLLLQQLDTLRRDQQVDKRIKIREELLRLKHTCEALLSKL